MHRHLPCTPRGHHAYMSPPSYISNMASLRLAIEPIPAGSRLASLARMLPPAQWDAIRRAAYRQARFRCQACGRQARLHCHEVWQYAEQTDRQWLAGLLALCPECHAAKHILFAHTPALRGALLQHFAAVNRLSPDQAQLHVRVAMDRQRQLDERQWVVDYGPYNPHVHIARSMAQSQAFAASARPGRKGSQPQRVAPPSSNRLEFSEWL